MSNDLTTDGLEIFSLLPEAPLRPEARGICHICHMVNPALSIRYGRSTTALTINLLSTCDDVQTLTERCCGNRPVTSDARDV